MIPAKYRDEVRKYLDGDDVSDEFLNYLHANPNILKRIGKAFEEDKEIAAALMLVPTLERKLGEWDFCGMRFFKELDIVPLAERRIANMHIAYVYIPVLEDCAMLRIDDGNDEFENLICKSIDNSHAVRLASSVRDGRKCILATYEYSGKKPTAEESERDFKRGIKQIEGD